MVKAILGFKQFLTQLKINNSPYFMLIKEAYN